MSNYNFNKIKFQQIFTQQNYTNRIQSFDFLTIIPMKIIALIKSTYQNIMIAKKLLWFLFNLISMIPPFKQFKYLTIKIAQIIKSLYPKLIKIIQNNYTFTFIYELQKQTVCIVLLVFALATYAYLKFYKLKTTRTLKKDKHQKLLKMPKKLQNLSQKSIIVKNKHNPNNDNDRCYQEIHKHLKPAMSNEDKLFLQILKQYQNIDQEAEKRPQFNQIFYEADQITNKDLLDNSSTQVGGRKPASKYISPAHKIKREQDLNRSF